jgi:hypothetical protein
MYADLVFATADFMASFPVYNKEKACYNLAPPLIPAQESLDKMCTFILLLNWLIGTGACRQHNVGASASERA